MAMDSPLQSSFLYRGTWKHEIDTIILSTMARLKRTMAVRVRYSPATLFSRLSPTFKELLGIAGYLLGSTEQQDHRLGEHVGKPSPCKNHLFGAYHSSGDPAYKELRELFAVNESMQGIERTLIVLSDSVEAAGHLCDAPKKNAQPVEPGEVNSGNPFSLARRKLMFDDGGPQDLESTNKNVTGRVLPRETPSRSPTLTYSCGSSKPVTWYRMPRKPDI
ncbi:hypothetical protein SASPL_151224 [Salvia splendens]|uniref:Uncharacterized protein n=1 Tax=Salvia splendens TaxID=180675 RepID=A0A8X8W887_SALSN|nr:hypothetical protein SASPL_151224 [Salvia splendens]